MAARLLGRRVGSEGIAEAADWFGDGEVRWSGASGARLFGAGGRAGVERSASSRRIAFGARIVSGGRGFRRRTRLVFLRKDPGDAAVGVSKRFEGRSCDSPLVPRRGCLDWERWGAIVRGCASRAFSRPFGEWRRRPSLNEPRLLLLALRTPLRERLRRRRRRPLFRLVEAESVLVN